MISALGAWIIVNFFSSVVCVAITGAAIMDWFSLDFSTASPGLIIIARKRVLFPTIIGLSTFLNLLVALDAYFHFLPSVEGVTIRVWTLVVASALTLVAVCVYYFEGIYAASVRRRKK